MLDIHSVNDINWCAELHLMSGAQMLVTYILNPLKPASVLHQCPEVTWGLWYPDTHWQLSLQLFLFYSLWQPTLNPCHYKNLIPHCLILHISIHVKFYQRPFEIYIHYFSLIYSISSKKKHSVGLSNAITLSKTFVG